MLTHTHPHATKWFPIHAPPWASLFVPIVPICQPEYTMPSPCPFVQAVHTLLISVLKVKSYCVVRDTRPFYIYLYSIPLHCTPFYSSVARIRSMWVRKASGISTEWRVVWSTNTCTKLSSADAWYASCLKIPTATSEQERESREKEREHISHCGM